MKRKEAKQMLALLKHLVWQYLMSVSGDELTA